MGRRRSTTLLVSRLATVRCRARRCRRACGARRHLGLAGDRRKGAIHDVGEGGDGDAGQAEGEHERAHCRRLVAKQHAAEQLAQAADGPAPPARSAPNRKPRVDAARGEVREERAAPVTEGADEQLDERRLGRAAPRPRLQIPQLAARQAGDERLRRRAG